MRKKFTTSNKLAVAKLNPKRRVLKERKCCAAAVKRYIAQNSEVGVNLSKRIETLEDEKGRTEGAIRGARSLLEYLDSRRFRVLADKLKLVAAAGDLNQIIRDLLTDTAFTLEGVAERRDAVVELDTDSWNMPSERFNEVVRGIKA